MQAKRIKHNLIWIIFAIVIVSVILATCSITYADYANKVEGSSTASPRGVYIADKLPINYYPQTTSDTTFNYYMTNVKEGQLYPQDAVISVVGTINDKNSGQIADIKVEANANGTWQNVTVSKNGDTFSFKSLQAFSASKPSIQYFRISFKMTWGFPLSDEVEAFKLEYSIEVPDVPEVPEGNYQVSLDADKQVSLTPQHGSKMVIYTGDLESILQKKENLLIEPVVNLDDMYVNMYYNGHLQTQITVFTKTHFDKGVTYVQIGLKDNNTGQTIDTKLSSDYKIKVYIPESISNKITIDARLYPY